MDTRLRTRGFRFTPQRDHVYSVLLRKRDHPTAEELFIRAKRDMPEISLATVYNCLEALVRCGLARQVKLDCGAARFCPNMSEHSHFFCDVCERVFDIASDPGAGVRLPEGFQPARFDLAIHGCCPHCAGNGRS